MKQDNGKRALEGLKIFPYVAWGLTVWFAYFVYTITTDLQIITTDLQEQTAELQRQVQESSDQADFDAYRETRFGNRAADAE